MKSAPKIAKYMTTAPYAVRFDAPLTEVMELMKKHHCRHLPVIREGKAFGLISERDIKNVMSFQGANPKALHAEDICGDEPYLTKPDALLSDVASEMSERRIGSALVLDNGKLVGIFTTTDACRALSDICSQRFHAA